VQNKPKMVEAVMFFNEHGVCREMLFPEFEAVLDAVVGLPDLADQQVRLAYILISPKLEVHSAVFFHLDFDEDGGADPNWNLPLRQLSERGEPGMDLGAGPVRLVSRSQCPVPWHQMHLWDPEPADLLALRDAASRNSLGLLRDEGSAISSSTPPSRTPASSSWSSSRHRAGWHDAEHADDSPQGKGRHDAEHAADSPQGKGRNDVEHVDDSLQGKGWSDDKRRKTASLIKRQRDHIRDLGRYQEEELGRLKRLGEHQIKTWRSEVEELREQLREQQALNARLETQRRAGAEALTQAEADLAQLTALQEHELAAREEELLQVRQTLQSRVDELEAELAASREREASAEAEALRLEQEGELQAVQGIERALGGLAALGMTFVVYHPGAGHLTIPLQDIARYQENPMAYAAAKCSVSEAQYRQWLSHFQQPTCEAVLSGGRRCALPIDRVDMPQRFVSGDSNCCSRHKSSGRLQDAG